MAFNMFDFINTVLGLDETKDNYIGLTSFEDDKEVITFQQAKKSHTKIEATKLTGMLKRMQ